MLLYLISYEQISAYSEFTFILFSFYYHRLSIDGSKIGIESDLAPLYLVPELLLFLCAGSLVLASAPDRLLGVNQLEDRMAALVILMLPLKLLYFCRAPGTVGPSVMVMIHKFMANDAICFIVLVTIFVARSTQCK